MNGRTKVLVVDDDVVSRMVLMHLVDSGGSYDVLEAEDGEDAWRLLDGGLRPAIVFCDLRMPRLSGMELLERVRADARFTGMPFVLASAADERATVDQASLLGASGYLVKPFDPEAVRALLASLGAGVDVAEAPGQTLDRLGIDSTRLLLYLGGLHKQLADASAAIGQLVAAGDADGARARLERLREGCATLGLAAAAQALSGAAAKSELSVCDAEQALDTARRCVAHQSELARALPLA